MLCARECTTEPNGAVVGPRERLPEASFFLNYSRVALLFVAAVCPTAVGAQPLSPETTSVPKSAFYVGIGGSANFSDFGTQSLYNKGISNVFTNTDEDP